MYHNGTEILRKSGITANFGWDGYLNAFVFGAQNADRAKGWFGAAIAYKRVLTENEIVKHFQDSPNYDKPSC